MNEELRRIIRKYLAQRSDIPVIAVGTPLPGLMLDHFRYINTSDENDFADITNYLIEIHGFSDIHILTGHENIASSHHRVAGFRRAMQEHQVPCDERAVIFGDFWTTSGRARAKKYISGQLPFPQVLICGNDYMAYGILDEFMERGINITEKMALIGYEHIGERHCHTPLLTTYRKNRAALGRAAVTLAG